MSTGPIAERVFCVGECKEWVKTRSYKMWLAETHISFHLAAIPR